jgi:RsiW-degrading membrane proteinase PrsW (M82 family)
MVSALWVLVAFVLGGFLGLLVMALMYMSAGLPKQSSYVPPELRGINFRSPIVSDGC